MENNEETDMLGIHIIRPICTISKSGKKRLEEIRDKKEIYEFIDSASPQEVRKLTEVFKHLKKGSSKRELSALKS